MTKCIVRKPPAYMPLIDTLAIALTAPDDHFLSVRNFLKLEPITVKGYS
ncbi:MAG: hypothetical protein WCG08_09400 [Paludibacter sp.]